MRYCRERITSRVILQVLMVIALFFTIWIISGSKALADDDGLNMKNAEQLSLGEKKTVHVSASDYYYYKTFKFNTTGNDSYYNVTVTNSTIDDSMVFQVYDSSGIKVDGFNESGIHEHEEDNEYDKLGRGETYYVLVYFDSIERSGDYKIQVDEIKDDAGDDSYHAVNKAPGRIDGTIEVGADCDWYKITARRSGKHKISIKNPNSSGTIYYEIFDKDVLRETNSYVSSGYESGTIEYKMSAGDYFYIRIDGSEWNLKYILSISEPNITPSKVVLKKMKTGKGSLTVKYKEAKRTTYYQIAYRTKSSKWKLKKSSRLSKKIKKLARKKTYLVKVRGVRVYNGTNYYGAWSKVKKARTK